MILSKIENLIFKQQGRQYLITLLGEIRTAVYHIIHSLSFCFNRRTAKYQRADPELLVANFPRSSGYAMAAAVSKWSVY